MSPFSKKFAYVWLTLLFDLLCLLPWPFTLVTGFLFWFLPGYVMLRHLFGVEVDAGPLSVRLLKYVVLATSLGTLLSSLVLMSTLWIISLPLKAVAPFTVNVVTLCSFIVNRKRARPTLVLPAELKHKGIFLAMMTAVFIYDLYFSLKIFYMTSPGMTFLPWDTTLYFRLIQSFRHGQMPPPRLIVSGVEETVLEMLAPVFVFHATFLELTGSEIVSYALLMNAFFHLMVACVTYFLLTDVFRDEIAGIISALYIGFSNDLTGALEVVRFDPLGLRYLGMHPYYLGTASPSLARYPLQASVENVFFLWQPSIAFDLLWKGFYHGASFLSFLLVLYFIGHWKRPVNLSLVMLILSLANPLSALNHYGITAVLFSTLVVALVCIEINAKLQEYFGRKVDMLLLNLLVLASAFFIISLLDLPILNLIFVRILPISVVLPTLIVYLGPVFVLASVGALCVGRAADRTPCHSALISCLVLSTFLVAFCDIYNVPYRAASPTDLPTNNTFSYLSWSLTTIICGGIGFGFIRRLIGNLASGPVHRVADLTIKMGRGIFHVTIRSLPNRSLARWLMLMLLSASFLSILPTALFIDSTDYGKIEREYYGGEFSYSSLEGRAYEWITTHTDMSAVFLTAPEHWWLPSLTGRQVVYSWCYLDPRRIPSDRTSDVDLIYATEDLKLALSLLMKYAVNYVVISRHERARYLDGFGKFYNNESVFRRVFSEEGLDIFEVTYHKG